MEYTEPLKVKKSQTDSSKQKVQTSTNETDKLKVQTETNETDKLKTFTQASAGSSYSSDENFIKQARVLTLGAMRKLKVDTFCVTVATTSHVKVSNGGWYFRGCQDCSCKAEGSVPPFICKNGHKTNQDIIRYKLDVEVYDGDDTTKFVFWDNTLNEILGISAATLLEKQKQISELLPVAESSSKGIPTNQEQLFAIEDSPPIQIFDKTDIEKFASLDDSMLSTPNVSAIADVDTSASSKKTPAKRTASKNPAVESTNLEAQF
ncbi:hypothetical protein TSUD_89330 [Trifolium subterraneum]|uniref:Replication factor A C-terminal domain-containing protein n=1 Tax=Trifolium subterraneum TaxID=3900 RepID=A0A2Z6MA13_TRISU|nr:hypothetical protein TSUD_89330 [Trifolium subterraneum]